MTDTVSLIQRIEYEEMVEVVDGRKMPQHAAFNAGLFKAISIISRYFDGRPAVPGKPLELQTRDELLAYIRQAEQVRASGQEAEPDVVERVAKAIDARIALHIRQAIGDSEKIVDFKPMLLEAAKAAIASMPSVAGYERVLADHRRLVRELDIALNGEKGAAEQASLCDIVAQVKSGRPSGYSVMDEELGKNHSTERVCPKVENREVPSGTTESANGDGCRSREGNDLTSSANQTEERGSKKRTMAHEMGASRTRRNGESTGCNKFESTTTCVEQPVDCKEAFNTWKSSIPAGQGYNAYEAFVAGVAANAKTKCLHERESIQLTQIEKEDAAFIIADKLIEFWNGKTKDIPEWHISAKLAFFALAKKYDIRGRGPDNNG